MTHFPLSYSYLTCFGKEINSSVGTVEDETRVV